MERHLLNKSARMQGFLVWDYEHRYEEAVARLAAWVRAGSLRYREEILPALHEQFGFANVMQVPGLTKIVVNMGVGDAVSDRKVVDSAPTLEESRAVLKAGLVSLPWEGLKLSRGDSAVPVRFTGGEHQ